MWGVDTSPHRNSYVPEMEVINMSFTKAKQLAEEMQLGRYNFNVEILSRFMSESEVRELDKAYKSVLKGGGFGGNRFANLKKEITEEDRKIVKGFLDDVSETPVSQLEKEMGFSQGTYANKAGRAALKYIYQNKINI